MKTDAIIGNLKEVLKNLGVHSGDILYVSSDIKALLFKLAMDYGVRSGDETDAVLDKITDAFQDVVGREGTLLFPVFSWDWCRGKGFDYNKTKGEVGTFSNWILEKRHDFKRTRHPIYSFMVWGQDRDFLVNMDNQDAWSRQSPFYYLYKNSAKQLLFNIEPYQGYTFGHYMEQEADVPYRHTKYFFGEYTDENGDKEIRMYSMFVRDMNVEVECGIRNGWLVGKGVAWQDGWEGSLLTIVDIEKSYSVLKEDLTENNGKNALHFAKGSLNWGEKRSVPYEVEGIDI